ncbi:MAG: hypothetical protein J5647_09780 [Spirochaetaceae bacterium]|nr:hypothetical protein [Spirochaetaceae bacterium]
MTYLIRFIDSYSIALADTPVRKVGSSLRSSILSAQVYPLRNAVGIIEKPYKIAAIFI